MVVFYLITVTIEILYIIIACILIFLANSLFRYLNTDNKRRSGGRLALRSDAFDHFTTSRNRFRRTYACLYICVYVRARAIAVICAIKRTYLVIIVESNQQTILCVV